MMINNFDLKKASENFYIKKDELYNDILFKDETKGRHVLHRPFRGFTALIIVFSLLLTCCITAYATSPKFRNYINLWFMTDNNNRQESVPEGYTGIYTIKELDNIRNNLNGKYILMNDLTFSDNDFSDTGAYKGGWVPIGDYQKPFCGEFDGNGYTINNLILNTESKYVGLFGEANNPNTIKNDDDTFLNINDVNKPYDGIIKNLGLRGVTANITIKNDQTRFIGSIVAAGKYIIGCFADEVKINVVFYNFQPLDDSVDSDPALPFSKGDIKIGGICGKATVIDSCYANADVTITDEKDYRNLYAINEILYVGGITAISEYAVTSYYCGDILFNKEEYGSGEILGYNSFLPFLMSEARFNNVLQSIKENKKTERDPRMFQPFYLKRQLSQREKDMLFTGTDSSGQYYVLDPSVSIKEIIRLEKILLYAYTEDEVRQGTLDDSIKSGSNYCYTIEKDILNNQNYFEGFDFDNIWIMKNGFPTLRIFI